MSNYIKRSSYLLLLLAVMVLLSSCVSNAPIITVHMNEGNLQEQGLSLYGRFEDGTVTKAVYSPTEDFDDYVINNPQGKWVVGGYVTDGVMSWSPTYQEEFESSSEITLLDTIESSKPEYAAAYVAVDIYGPGPMGGLLGLSVYSDSGQLLSKGSTELFAMSTNPDIGLIEMSAGSMGPVLVKGVSTGTEDGATGFLIAIPEEQLDPQSEWLPDPQTYLKIKSGSKELPFSFTAKPIKKQTLRKGGANKAFTAEDLASDREDNALSLVEGPQSSNPNVAVATIVDEQLVIEPGTRSGTSVITVQVSNGVYAIPVSISVQIPSPPAPDSPNTVDGGVGGIQSLDGVSVNFPPGASGGKFKVDITKMGDTTGLPTADGAMIIGAPYSITKDTSGNFDKPVTITMKIDPALIDNEAYSYAIYWFDEAVGQWMKLDHVTFDPTTGQVTGQTDHFTTFAVLATELEKPEVVIPVTLTDISGHWAEKSIVQLVGAGVLSGYPDGSFQPEKPITRAEFAAGLVKALGLSETGDKVFADTNGHWAQKQIATAVANGIAAGYEGDLFKPDASVTREEIAVMVARAVDLKRGAQVVLPKDAAVISPWAVDSVAALMEKGVFSGYLDGSFNPKGLATRAEAAAIIVNTLNKL